VWSHVCWEPMLLWKMFSKNAEHAWSSVNHVQMVSVVTLVFLDTSKIARFVQHAPQLACLVHQLVCASPVRMDTSCQQESVLSIAHLTPSS